jgi:hypothetical protein
MNQENHNEEINNTDYKSIGQIISIIASLLLIYFLFFFDTSVSAGSGYRVNNLGLMQDKQNFIIFSSVVLLIGVFLYLKDYSNKNINFVEPVINESQIASYEAEKDLDSDAYKIFLVAKYKVRKNEVLGKYEFNNQLFDNVDFALEHVHKIEISEDKFIIDSNVLKKKEEEEILSKMLHNDNQYIEFLSKKGYKLDERIIANGKIIWKFSSVTGNGSFEFNNIEDLIKFLNNFK